MTRVARPGNATAVVAVAGRVVGRSGARRRLLHGVDAQHDVDRRAALALAFGALALAGTFALARTFAFSGGALALALGDAAAADALLTGDARCVSSHSFSPTATSKMHATAPDAAAMRASESARKDAIRVECSAPTAYRTSCSPPCTHRPRRGFFSASPATAHIFAHAAQSFFAAAAPALAALIWPMFMHPARAAESDDGKHSAQQHGTSVPVLTAPSRAGFTCRCDAGHVKRVPGGVGVRRRATHRA